MKNTKRMLAGLLVLALVLCCFPLSASAAMSKAAATKNLADKIVKKNSQYITATYTAKPKDGEVVVLYSAKDGVITGYSADYEDDGQYYTKYNQTTEVAAVSGNRLSAEWSNAGTLITVDFENGRYAFIDEYYYLEYDEIYCMCNNGTYAGTIGTAEDGDYIEYNLIPSGNGYLLKNVGSSRYLMISGGLLYDTDSAEKATVFTFYVVDEDTGSEESCYGYIDIDRNSWYHEAVDYAIANGFMGSTKPGALTFEPTTSCTRSMIVTILYSLAGKPAVGYEAKFPDVKDGQWYTSAVMWAYQNGIVSGYNTGNFGPNDKITREQMAVVLKACAETFGLMDTSASADLSSFPDANKVTWSKAALEWAVAEGLISGKLALDKTYLDPQGNASRAEVAVILKNFIFKIEN